MKRGRLIAFEGGEACGKTTQARLLAEELGAVLTREPGGTRLGQLIRDLILDRGSANLDARTEALLMAADRAQHVAEVIEPALSGGHDVVTDRFTPSSLAYQGHGRGLPVDEVGELSRWAARQVEADLVVLLEVPRETAGGRRARPLDRLEAEDDEFHRRVAGGYRELAAADPARWVVVEGAGTVEEVASRVRAAFARWAAS